MFFFRSPCSDKPSKSVKFALAQGGWETAVPATTGIHKSFGF